MVANFSDGALLGASAIGVLGSLGGSLLQGAWNGSANTRAYHHQRDLMNLQAELNKEYNIWSMQHAPALVRQGYESAGYNPILALGSSVNNTNAVGLGSAPQPNSINSDIASSATNAYRAYKLERERNTAEVNATNAGASLALEQARTEEFRRNMLASQTFLNNIDYSLKSKELSWYDRRQLQELKSMYINSQANMLGAQASMNQAHTAKLGYELEKEMQGYQKDLFKFESEWRSRHPYQAGIQAGISNWTRPVGNIFHSGYSVNKK